MGSQCFQGRLYFSGYFRFTRVVLTRVVPLNAPDLVRTFRECAFLAICSHCDSPKRNDKKRVDQGVVKDLPRNEKPCKHSISTRNVPIRHC